MNGISIAIVPSSDRHYVSRMITDSIGMLVERYSDNFSVQPPSFSFTNSISITNAPRLAADLPPYALMDEPRVFAFLEDRQNLVPVLCEVYKKISSHFDASRITLELEESEAYLGGRNLVITIHTGMSPVEVARAFDSLYDDSLLNRLSEVGDLLLITVEFDEL